MAYTGMADFRTALAALEVDGIDAYSRLAQAPETLSVSLPLSFPRISGQTGEAISLTSASGLKMGAMEYVIVVQAANLSTTRLNLDAACALLDALDDSLRDAAADLGLDEWSIRAEIELFGGAPYWTLVTTVRASG